MPESKKRDKVVEKEKNRRGQKKKDIQYPGSTPKWWVVTMTTLLIAGLLWIIVFYITAGLWPVYAWGNWNILAGGLISLVGFAMTLRWR